MAVSKSMIEAVDSKNLNSIYSLFYTILLSDPGFKTDKFDEAFRYVTSCKIDGFIQPHNGDSFAPQSEWDDKYWDKVASELVDNFSVERIQHIKEVAKKVYPRIDESNHNSNNAQKKTDSMQNTMVQKNSSSNSMMIIGVVVVVIIILILLIVLVR